MSYIEFVAKPSALHADAALSGGFPMSFALYLVGLLLLVGGIAWGLTTAGVAEVYVGIACLIVLGLGIMTAVSRTRTKDPS
ncbi:hypothetical protein [Cupriavidus sp. AU9028]|uniref:hypothetical protein n=1 Tax=Cupriavidus sp. AU9028 TaxID=2871157 RepID=UPI001C984543|nr:hypothetical protein [Cupriavidus sp. AU9028]MBY4896830.1 hypothetical protein [Cupriavidus sp. AU9028]